MLGKEELNYLAMLVVCDQRTAVRKHKENSQLEEAKKQKDVRQTIIDKLNSMYDELGGRCMDETTVEEIKKVLKYLVEHCPSQIGFKERKGSWRCARGECMACWCEALNVED